MSDVERLFRYLVGTLLEGDPGQLQRPLTLHELMTRVIPYRAVRRQLGVDSSEDYELLVLRLAGGESGFATVEPEPVQVRFAEEAVSVNPDLSVLHEYKDARLAVAQDALAWVLAGRSKEELYAPPAAEAASPPQPALDEIALEHEPAVAPPPPQPPPAPAPPAPPPPTADAPVFERVPPRASAPPSHAPPPPPPPAKRPATPAAATTAGVAARRCSMCAGRLPLGREVNYCPHCGHAQGTAACPYCEAEVEYGWRHCIGCGGELLWEG